MEGQQVVRLSLGRCMITQGATAALEASGQHAAEFLARHQFGDWGEVPTEDAISNEVGAIIGARVLSVYRTKKDRKVWVITDPGHKFTTLLLPEEY